MVGILTRDMAMGIADPALSSVFVVRVPFVMSMVEVVAEQCTVTFYKTPAQARFNGGTNFYYPGTTDVDGISITFYESYEYRVSSWLTEWRKLIYNPETRNFGLPVDYKKDIIVDIYSQASTSPARTVTYKGCWVTDRAPFELNTNEETGRITVQAQFSVDTQEETLGNTYGSY